MTTQARILIIDDDTSTLEIIVKVLETAGFEGIVENDCRLSFLQKNILPDLILLDNNLGEITGCELCKQIKKMDHVKHIPIILISAMEDIPRFAVEACADGFLMKPFGIQPLLEKIKQLLPEKVNAQ